MPLWLSEHNELLNCEAANKKWKYWVFLKNDIKLYLHCFKLDISEMICMKDLTYIPAVDVKAIYTTFTIIITGITKIAEIIIVDIFENVSSFS